MLNTSAANISLVRLAQAQALLREDVGAILNKLTAGNFKIRFSTKDPVISISTITVNIVFSPIAFKVLLINTPFLLYLSNINKLSIYLNNTVN